VSPPGNRQVTLRLNPRAKRGYPLDKTRKARQVTQMGKNNLPGLSPLWLIALALGTSVVTLIPVSIAGGDTIKSSDWIGFSGSIVGACIALLAAFIAYSAIREQTRSTERVAATSS
jgi:membrane associated rhomboid family serine protease